MLKNTRSFIRFRYGLIGTGAWVAKQGARTRGISALKPVKKTLGRGNFCSGMKAQTRHQGFTLQG